ncbi:component of Sp100-rs-like [Lemur catta]|uniref:component of Sp100-rs-like n=1 Tax=Lemur catta TaxID=9447 RepID=UPI001E268AB6|nr:component of Sp100-rs-like [Lemur catta]
MPHGSQLLDGGHWKFFLGLTKRLPLFFHVWFSWKRELLIAALEKDPDWQRAKLLPKIMNLSSEHCDISDWLRLEATVKASVYVVAFSFATFITALIIVIVSQNLNLRREV